MDPAAPNQAVIIGVGILPPEQALADRVPALTPAEQAALATAHALAQQATAPATLRAYKAESSSAQLRPLRVRQPCFQPWT
jgi:hypothetical protein